MQLKAALISILFSAAALGAPRQSLVVLPVPLDSAAEGAALGIDYAAEQAAARSGRFELQRLVDALDPQGAQARAGHLARGQEAVKAGQAAYDNLESLKAIEHFDQAITELKQTDLSVHFGELMHALAMRAAARIANGKSALADQELARVIALDPRIKLSPNYFPPDELALAEKARHDEREGTLEIASSPAAAKLFVDGSYRGVAPAAVDGAGSLTHFVTAIAPGFALTTAEGGPKLTVKLAPAPKQEPYRAAVTQIRGEPDGKDRDVAAQEFGRAVAADQVLLVIAKKSTVGDRVELTLERIDVGDGHNLGYLTRVVPQGDGLLAAVDPLLGEVLGRDAPRLNGQPVTHFAPQKPITGYALFGGGLAAAGVGGVLAATTGSVRTRNVGLGVALVGLVTAGVGAYLTWFQHPTAAPEKPGAKKSHDLGSEDLRYD